MNAPTGQRQPRSRATTQRTPVPGVTATLLALGLALPTIGLAAETWRGLVIAPEARCSPYERSRDYRYPQAVEKDIVRALGSVYGPYTRTCFASTRETDIEHLVATSEAHDSGLCHADRATRTRFARDLRNLTLASPRVNRDEKGGRDASEWLPRHNRCWFANQVIEVKRAYGLTVDRREARALERILATCVSTALDTSICEARTGPAVTQSDPEPMPDALFHYDDNHNGRISCAEARRHRIAPVHRHHPAYRHMRDGDGDGIVCE